MTGIYYAHILRVWLNTKLQYGLIVASDATMNGYPAILRMSRVSALSAKVLIGTDHAKTVTKVKEGLDQHANRG